MKMKAEYQGKLKNSNLYLVMYLGRYLENNSLTGLPYDLFSPVNSLEYL